jgi:hypothetical protein
VTGCRTGSSLTLIAKEIEEALVAWRIDLAAVFVTIPREQDKGDAVEARSMAAQRDRCPATACGTTAPARSCGRVSRMLTAEPAKKRR